MSEDNLGLANFTALSTGKVGLPTDAQRELLAILSEESGETIQVVGKILRHGYNAYNPLLKDELVMMNRSLLHKEAGHIVSALALLVASGDLSLSLMRKSAILKLDNIDQWLRFQASSTINDAKLLIDAVV